jgi:hypothetical protein
MGFGPLFSVRPYSVVYASLAMGLYYLEIQAQTNYFQPQSYRLVHVADIVYLEGTLENLYSNGVSTCDNYWN